MRVLIAVAVLFSQLSFADDAIKRTFYDDLVEAVQEGNVKVVKEILNWHSEEILTSVFYYHASKDGKSSLVMNPSGAWVTYSLLFHSSLSRDKEMLSFMSKVWTKKFGKEKTDEILMQILREHEVNMFSSARSVVDARRLVEDGPKNEIDAHTMTAWRKDLAGALRAYDEAKKQYNFTRSYALENGLIKPEGEPKPMPGITHK